MLAAAHKNHDAHHVGVLLSLAIATVVVGHGCSLMKSLLAPHLATLGALPSILGGDFSRHPNVAAQDWVKLGHLVAGGILCDGASQLLDGVPDSIGCCLGG
jgi:hypothetical protein